MSDDRHDPDSSEHNAPEGKCHRLMRGCIDPRLWELLCYAIATVSAAVAIGLVYGGGSFRPFGSLVKVDGPINNGLSSVLYVNMDKFVAKLPNQALCAFDAKEFDKVFSTNGESAATSTLGFFIGASAIFSFVLTLVYYMIFRSHFSFNRQNGKKAKKKRFLMVLILNVFMFISFTVSAFVIFFGLESTLNNLDKDECFVSCADCPQNFCKFQNTFAPSVRSTCPEGFSHQSSRSFADAFAALSAAQGCCWVGAASILMCIIFLFVGEPSVTYKTCCKSDSTDADRDIEMQSSRQSHKSSHRDSQTEQRRGSHKSQQSQKSDAHEDDKHTDDGQEDDNDVIMSA